MGEYEKERDRILTRYVNDVERYAREYEERIIGDRTAMDQILLATFLMNEEMKEIYKKYNK